MELEAAKLIGAGLAVIGVIGSGIGIGTIFASFIQAVGRNPAAQGAVFPMPMLGFALVEAIALFALVIALVILFGYDYANVRSCYNKFLTRGTVDATIRYKYVSNTNLLVAGNVYTTIVCSMEGGSSSGF